MKRSPFMPNTQCEKDEERIYFCFFHNTQQSSVCQWYRNVDDNIYNQFPMNPKKTSETHTRLCWTCSVILLEFQWIDTQTLIMIFRFLFVNERWVFSWASTKWSTTYTAHHFGVQYIDIFKTIINNNNDEDDEDDDKRSNWFIDVNEWRWNVCKTKNENESRVWLFIRHP